MKNNFQGFFFSFEKDSKTIEIPNARTQLHKRRGCNNTASELCKTQTCHKNAST